MNVSRKIIVTILLGLISATISAQEVLPSDSLQEPQPVRLPLLTPLGTYPTTLGYYSWTGSLGFGEWQLHEGLNVTLGASVFASFGKNAYHGAGFGQNAAMMYAMPITPRLTAAGGVYMNNLTWGSNTYRTAGVSALMNYQLTDRLDAFMFGQKQLVSSVPIPMRFFDMDDFGDRLGIGFHYKVSPSFSFSASFSYGNNRNDDLRR